MNVMRGVGRHVQECDKQATPNGCQLAWSPQESQASPFSVLQKGVPIYVEHILLSDPFLALKLMNIMFVTKRDGHHQNCQFDKVQRRIANLCFGLDHNVSSL